ncbi:MAG: biopolymer transporter ExbD, partial [Pseudomonadales bacterium]|nr:biopolymer transporter ExbD [Pseudomonadales bacterium]
MSFNIDDDDDEVMSDINMTPLVDVMLVLLIIFMITVPVLTHSVKVDLPRASNQPNQVQNK